MTYSESLNHAQNTHVHILKCRKSTVPEVKMSEIAT